MADKDLKVMIELSADAKGVKAGVKSAKKEFEELKKSVNDIRDLAMVGIAVEFGKMLFDGVKAEFQHIVDATHTYSAQGMSGQLALDQGTMKADMKLAEAFGPFIELIDNINAQGLIDVADFLVANKQEIGDAMVAMAEFGVAVAELTAQGVVVLSGFINWLDNLTGKNGVRGAVEAGTSAISNQLGFGPGGTQAFMALYDLLADKLGGD